MAPTPLKELKAHVERTQASVSDPAERIRALAVVKQGLEDLLGTVATYIRDAQLEQEGNAASDSNAEGGGSPDASAEATEPQGPAT